MYLKTKRDVFANKLTLSKLFNFVIIAPMYSQCNVSQHLTCCIYVMSAHTPKTWCTCFSITIIPCVNAFVMHSNSRQRRTFSKFMYDQLLPLATHDTETLKYCVTKVKMLYCLFRKVIKNIQVQRLRK